MVKRNSVNTWITPTTASEVTVPAQPAFLAYLASNDATETGDGTVFILGDTDVGTALTEVFDQNADFSTGSSSGAIFTAPATGRYLLGTGLWNYNYDDTQTSTITRIVTSNGTYQIIQIQPTNTHGTSAYLLYMSQVLCDMDSADTAYVTFVSSGGNKTVGLGGGRSTHFQGVLIC